MKSGRVAALVILLLTGGSATASDTDEPFGRSTVAAAPGPLRDAWAQIEDKIRGERELIGRCRGAPASCPSPAAGQFNAIVREGTGDDDRTRIGRLNRAVNLAIKPMRTGAGPTEWASPLETLTVGAGDCKQYAVVKYAALLEAGFAVDRVRLVIVRIKPKPPTFPAADHAVTAVRVQLRWLILDNRSLTASESTGLLNDMDPLFTLDNRGVRQFVPAGATAIPASPCGDKQP